MLKFQIALAIILVGCIAFSSCDRRLGELDMVPDDTGTDMPTDMTLDLIKMGAYTSWMHKMLPAPVPMADAMSPAETGAAHNPAHATTGITTARTFYINDIGVMANKEGTMYPAGTVIVKEIMDDTNMFVDKVAVMMKSDDPMYAGHNGWVYKKYARASQDAEYMQVRGSNLEDAGNGCHGCHAKATNDSVFVSLAPDVTGDGIGNIQDLVSIASAIGQPVTADNMHLDVNGDGVIDQADVEAAATALGADPADIEALLSAGAGDGATPEGTGDGAGNGDGNGNDDVPPQPQ